MKKLLVLICFLCCNFALGVDWNFGGGLGSSSYQCGDSIIWLDTCTSAAASGTLDSFVGYFDPNYEVRNLQYIICNADSTLLDTTAVINTSAGHVLIYYKGNAVNSGAISASTKYFIGFRYVNATWSHDAKIGYESSIASNWWYSAVVTSIPAKFPGGTKTAARWRMDIMGYYHDSGGTVYIIRPRRTTMDEDE